ncbi:hypothetical protein [Pinirhizobacter soli]|uniref:hypothetical protein n=1 Tax=Pinirhizobacter soli TaxID=2786953 RepID=UPI00202A64D9
MARAGGFTLAAKGKSLMVGLSSSVTSIVFDPAGYHARWSDDDRRAWSPRQRSALNDYLFAEYQLSPHDGKVSLSEGVARIVRGWANLRSAATYMAAARYAGSLQASRCFAGLPPSIHAFMRMGFAVSRKQPSGGIADQAALVELGGASLAALTPHVPAWLASRISLPFADMPMPAFDTEPFDLPCFWSALGHASRHPL